MRRPLTRVIARDPDGVLPPWQPRRSIPASPSRHATGRRCARLSQRGSRAVPSSGTLDGRMAGAEAVCLKIVARARGRSPRYPSRAWFAATILHELEAVRRLMTYAGEPSRQLAVSGALRLGFLCAEFAFRHDSVVLQDGIGRRRARSRAGRNTAKNKRTRAIGEAAALERLRGDGTRSYPQAARYHLKNTDPDWYSYTDAEHQHKIDALLKRARNARKRQKTPTRRK